MVTTPVSLLERLHQTDDHQAWDEFVELYTPVLLAWARRLGLQDADATDLVQDVLILLVRQLPRFVYDPSRSFRGWLRTVAHNEWRGRQGRNGPTPKGDALEVAAPVEEAFWEEEYRRHLVQRAMTLMQSEFEETTWKACWETVVHGRSAPEVASELGLQPGAVRAAKFRVLSRLRERLAGLMD